MAVRRSYGKRYPRKDLMPRFTESIFDKIWREATATNINLAEKNKKAIQWLADTVTQRPGRISDQALHGDYKNYTQSIGQNDAGMMYLFHYFPKYHATLPYYDLFPLVIPIEFYKGASAGFLGLNLHYLEPMKRLKLLNGLLQAFETTNGNRMFLTYNLLKGISQTNLYKPCVKRYLTKQLRSNFIPIERKNWEIALFLPVARFRKQSQQFVWSQSNQVSGLSHRI